MSAREDAERLRQALLCTHPLSELDVIEAALVAYGARIRRERDAEWIKAICRSCRDGYPFIQTTPPETDHRIEEGGVRSCSAASFRRTLELTAESARAAREQA